MGLGLEEKQREGRGPDRHPEPKEEPSGSSPEVCSGAFSARFKHPPALVPACVPAAPHPPPPRPTPTCGAVGRAGSG